MLMVCLKGRHTEESHFLCAVPQYDAYHIYIYIHIYLCVESYMGVTARLEPAQRRVRVSEWSPLQRKNEASLWLVPFKNQGGTINKKTDPCVLCEPHLVVGRVIANSKGHKPFSLLKLAKPLQKHHVPLNLLASLKIWDRMDRSWVSMLLAVLATDSPGMKVSNHKLAQPPCFNSLHGS